MAKLTNRQIDEIGALMRGLLTGAVNAAQKPVPTVIPLCEADEDSPVVCLAVLPLGDTLSIVALPPKVIKEFFCYKPLDGPMRTVDGKEPGDITPVEVPV